MNRLTDDVIGCYMNHISFFACTLAHVTAGFGATQMPFYNQMLYHPHCYCCHKITNYTFVRYISCFPNLLHSSLHQVLHLT